MNNKRTYISTYIFILSAFCLVLFLAYNNNEYNDMSLIINKIDDMDLKDENNKPLQKNNDLTIQVNQIIDSVKSKDNIKPNFSKSENV